MKSFHAALKAGTKFEIAKKGPSKGPLPVYLTAQDFKPQTASGQKNIRKYVEAMRTDFNAIHFPLVDKNAEAPVVALMFIMDDS